MKLNNRTQKIIFIGVLTLCLTHCATAPNRQDHTENHSQSKKSREITLNNIHHWNLKALVAIQSTAPQHNFTANLQWQQQTLNNYTILFFVPFGGTAELNSNAHQVTLKTTDGNIYKANTSEALLREQIGWNFPVSNLYYWVRGLPVPSIPARQNFDTDYHLIDLQQQGWQIHFSRYTSKHHIDLPDKISITHPNLRIKIVINEWQL